MKDAENPFKIAFEDYIQWWYILEEQMLWASNTQSLSEIKQSLGFEKR